VTPAQWLQSLIRRPKKKTAAKKTATRKAAPKRAASRKTAKKKTPAPRTGTSGAKGGKVGSPKPATVAA
jgi:hypothetical protein